MDKQSRKSSSLIPTEVPTHNIMTSQSAENGPTMMGGPLGGSGSKHNGHEHDSYISIGVGLLNLTIIVMVVTGCIAYRKGLNNCY